VTTLCSDWEQRLLDLVASHRRHGPAPSDAVSLAQTVSAGNRCRRCIHGCDAFDRSTYGAPWRESAGQGNAPSSAMDNKGRQQPAVPLPCTSEWESTTSSDTRSTGFISREEKDIDLLIHKSNGTSRMVSELGVSSSHVAWTDEVLMRLDRSGKVKASIRWEDVEQFRAMAALPRGPVIRWTITAVNFLLAYIGIPDSIERRGQILISMQVRGHALEVVWDAGFVPVETAQTELDSALTSLHQAWRASRGEPGSGR
jgi:hypothetical protein